MRFLLIPVLMAFCCQDADAQTSAKDVLAKFRTAIGADGPKVSRGFVIKYRGERFLYSLEDGKLQAQAFNFDASIVGHTDSPQTYRKEMEMKIGIVPFKNVEVVDGKSGWYQINDSDPVVMSKRLLEGTRAREIHIEIFLGRETFDPGHWKFTEPKSTRKHGQDVWEFDATTGGLEPITLSFDKQTGLLLHLRTKTDDVELMPGREPKLEAFTRDFQFSDSKKVGTRMYPGHFDAYRNGVLWIRMEPVSVSYPSTVDPKTFVMPPTKH